jgi:hypothetical protein
MEMAQEFLNQNSGLTVDDPPSPPVIPQWVPEEQRIYRPVPAHLARKQRSAPVPLSALLNLQHGTAVAAALRTAGVEGAAGAGGRPSTQQGGALNEEAKQLSEHTVKMQRRFEAWEAARPAHSREWVRTVLVRDVRRASLRTRMVHQLQMDVDETTWSAHLAARHRHRIGGGGGGSSGDISNGGDSVGGGNIGGSSGAGGGSSGGSGGGGGGGSTAGGGSGGGSAVPARIREVTVFSTEARHKIKLPLYTCGDCQAGQDMVSPSALLHGFWPSTPTLPSFWIDVQLLELYSEFSFREGVGATGAQSGILGWRLHIRCAVTRVVWRVTPHAVRPSPHAGLSPLAPALPHARLLAPVACLR